MAKSSSPVGLHEVVKPTCLLFVPHLMNLALVYGLACLLWTTCCSQVQRLGVNELTFFYLLPTCISKRKVSHWFIHCFANNGLHVVAVTAVKQHYQTQF